MGKELGIHLQERAFLQYERGESDSCEVHPNSCLREHVHYDAPVLGHSVCVRARECVCVRASVCVSE